MAWGNVTLLSKKDKLQKYDTDYAHNFNLIFKNICMEIILDGNIPTYKQWLTLSDGIISDLIFLYSFPPWLFLS